MRRGGGSISHRWLRPSADPKSAHPDDEQGTKLRALRNLVGPRKFVWLDFVCVPQRPSEEKSLAISSLPFYCRACERFTALVDGEQGKQDYLGRAWCQAELIISKLPERLPHWRPTWLHTRGRYYDMGATSSGYIGRVSAVLLDDVKDLADCALTVSADARPLAALVAHVLAELEALLAWDASADRAETRTFGSGRVRIDDDNERFDIPRWKPVRRVQLEGVVARLRSALSRPPFSEA